MAQPNDYVVDNDTGSAVRTDLNNLFDAISINNGFGSVPTTKYKYMWYADSVSDKMSFYKANPSNGKIDFISLSDGSFFGPNGSSSNPSYTFTNDTSTGFYRSASNEIGVSNNGTATATFTTGGQNIFGILSVAPTSGEAYIQVQTNSLNNQSAYLDLVADTTYTDYGLRFLRGNTGANSTSQIDHRGTGGLELIAHDGGTIDFKLGVAASNTLVTRWKFDSAGVFKWAEHSGTLPSGANVSGVIVPKGLASKTGSNAAATLSGNLYNFYWDGSSPNQLKCWIDEQDVGQVSGPSSDYRIKRNIATQTESGIDKIKKLRPITYQYADYKVFKASDSIREGFIAHEVQEVIPSGADGEKDGDSIQSLNIDAIVSVLTKALQEAVAKIETLEAKVAALEAS
jgi:hypothetical protein|tara:strand:+ start:1764 stop:2960 length:1197 start_codon:yes stop_codon:yes gene_type:complete